MSHDVKLSNIETVLEEFEYPVSQPAAAKQCADVTILLADGETNLGAIVTTSSSDSFESMDDLKTEVFNLLPRNAVGEPFQSEGEG